MKFSFGILAALAACLLLCVSQVLTRYFLTELGFNAWAFVALSTAVGGAGLIMISGWRGITSDMFAHGLTWAIGIAVFFDCLFFACAMLYITATEANLLVGLVKITSLVAALIAFKRAVGWSRLPGILLILAGFLPIIWRQDGGILNPGVIFAILTTLCLTIELVLTEGHPEILKAKTIRQRCGYTGALMTVTGLIFFVFIAAMSTAKPIFSGADMPLITLVYENLPTLAQVFDPLMIGIAFVFGLTIRAGLNFTRYYAVLKIHAENYLMIASIQGFTLFGLEKLAVEWGFLEGTSLDMSLVIYTALITIGSLLCFRRVKTRVE